MGLAAQVHLRSALTVHIKRELLECLGPQGTLDNFVPHSTYILLLDLESVERVRTTCAHVDWVDIVAPAQKLRDDLHLASRYLQISFAGPLDAEASARLLGEWEEEARRLSGRADAALFAEEAEQGRTWEIEFPEDVHPVDLADFIAETVRKQME
eukprot:tig00000850_g4799.t1